MRANATTIQFAPMIWNETAAVRIIPVVSHANRVQATPYGLPDAMLEIRADLIAPAQAGDQRVELCAPVLNMGLVEIQRQAKAG
ncbi:MAG: hypothetical protein ABIV25_04460 [Paracoccaceae bacterium]